MKNIKINSKLLALFMILGVAFWSCAELEVENPNNPSMADVLASPDDVKGVVESAFLQYWSTFKQYNIHMTSSVAADHSTASWGNFGWLDNSGEPRGAWNNDPSYNDSDMTESVWFDGYATISQVNDALNAINIGGMQIGVNGAENPMVVSTSLFIRGATLGQMALTFDQAFVVTEESDLALLEMQPWNEVMEAAINDLKTAAQIASQNTFTWGASAIRGMTANNTLIVELSNSYAARFLALAARTKAQADLSWSAAYSWQDVLTFAEQGLTRDFAPDGDGLPWLGGTWWDLGIKYLRQPGWARIDSRVINLMDPAYFVRYPTNAQGMALATTDPNFPNPHPGQPVGTAISDDARLLTDFQYLASNNFNPGRGGWHYSHYRHSRYDSPATTTDEGFFMGESLGPLFEFRVYDNELLKAEAKARLGDVAGAAAILNNPALPRKARGGLADVPVNLDAVMDAIFYERQIELAHNGYLMPFCDMRRRDLLQQGTPLHYPVPGRELETLQIPIYTFGGFNNADGINTSNGGDWIKPYYHFNQ
ncbi:MAG: RagB/SusD family nutrient uptake outer membrane protein [Bacteroidales bacterium]